MRGGEILPPTEATYCIVIKDSGVNKTIYQVLPLSILPGPELMKEREKTKLFLFSIFPNIISNSQFY